MKLLIIVKELITMEFYKWFLFDQNNGHCFVFKNTQNKLQGLTTKSILENMYSEEIPNDS